MSGPADLDTKANRRRLRELSAVAHVRELSAELAKVEEDFARWRSGEIDPFRRFVRHLGLCCLLLACLGACRSVVTIAQLNAQGRPAEGRRVTITGKVVDLAGRSPTGEYWYEIEDAGSRIWVSSRHPCPARGDRLRIEGRVTSAYLAYTNTSRPGEFGRKWAGLDIKESRRERLEGVQAAKPSPPNHSSARWSR